MKVNQLLQIIKEKKISGEAEILIGVYDFQKTNMAIPIESAVKYDYMEAMDPVSKKKIKWLVFFGEKSKHPTKFSEI